VFFCSKPTNVIIREIFNFFKLNIPKEEITMEKDFANAGKLIGIMERFMTLALILSTQFAAVGLIIVAKSLVSG